MVQVDLRLMLSPCRHLPVTESNQQQPRTQRLPHCLCLSCPPRVPSLSFLLRMPPAHLLLRRPHTSLHLLPSSHLSVPQAVLPWNTPVLQAPPMERSALTGHTHIIDPIIIIHRMYRNPLSRRKVSAAIQRSIRAQTYHTAFPFEHRLPISFTVHSIIVNTLSVI